MKRSWKVVTAFACLSLLAGCGGSGLDNNTTVGKNQATIVSIPGLSSTANFSFDLGTVYQGKYYVTDRNNKAVDVIDTTTLAVSQIKGTGSLAFTGTGGGSATGGPNGINVIPYTNQLYVGDVNGVKVVDIPSATVIGFIKVGTTGFRADEGCFDPDHHLYMIATPDADTPFASIINTDTQTVVATIVWNDVNGQPAGGNEQCRYDSGTQSFIVNNDNTVANPHGEVDVIPVASIQSIPAGGSANVFSLANVKRFPLGNCDPTGLALGPGTDMMAECRPGGAGSPLISIIMNRTNGQILATVPFGGADQIEYDARTNKYYIAANRWHTSGVNDKGGGCSASNPCAPTLGIVDASTRTLVATYATGNNAHSVAIDPSNGEVFMPISSAANPAGCPSCAANGFVTPGVAVFAL